MKRILSHVIMPLALIAAALPVYARTAKSVQVENGGRGPYKAVIVEDDALPGYSIFRPENLAAAAAVEGPLPVILFGNGGCAHNSVGFYNFLTEIASHGYVIISNGVWTEPRAPRPAAAPQGPRTPRPANTAAEALSRAKKLLRKRRSKIPRSTRARVPSITAPARTPSCACM